MVRFKNILYPVALTEISPVVAPYVVTMASQFDAQVFLLHVLRRFDWFVDTYVAEQTKPDFKRIASDFESQVHAQAMLKLNGFKERYLKDVRVADTAVVSGPSHKEIIKAVGSSGIDLIVMGTGNTLQNTILGSVAEKVSRLAPVPVLLINTDKAAASI